MRLRPRHQEYLCCSERRFPLWFIERTTIFDTTKRQAQLQTCQGFVQQGKISRVPTRVPHLIVIGDTRVCTRVPACTRSVYSRGPSIVPVCASHEKNGTTAAGTGTSPACCHFRLIPSVPSDFTGTAAAAGTTQPELLGDPCIPN